MAIGASDDSPGPGARGKHLELLVEILALWQYANSAEGLTAWEEAPESERARYRDLARQTLRTLDDAGYEIRRTADSADEPAAEAESTPDEGDTSPPRCREAAERFLRSGDPLLAYNVAQQGLDRSPDDLRLCQLQSLALARTGAVHRANQTLRRLRERGHVDGETMGLLARSHKDLASTTRDPEAQLAHLRAAFEIYEEAYLRESQLGNEDEAYYTGINAATMAFLCRDKTRAQEIASHVSELCTRALDRVENEDAAFWIHPTWAEAALILGDRSTAEAEYARAARAGRSRFGDLASTRRQARLLLHHMGEEDGWLEEILDLPPVLVYTGHMIDRPGRETTSFQASSEEAVRAEIRRRLERTRPIAAYGSAACGADILCLEAMLELGGETHIILPFPPAEFRRASVDIVPGWAGRFERVLDAADSVVVASQHRVEWSASSYEYANLILTGMGLLRSKQLETSLVGLAVWDGRPAGGPGGTGDVVDLWRWHNVRLEHVTLAALGEAPPHTDTAARPSPSTGSEPSHELRAMLFADAVGYSRFTEKQITIFIDRFLRAVAELNERSEHPPIYTQTVGDGLYFVFRDSSDAGHFALDLSELVRQHDWPGYGLPSTFGIRIGVHCGPVFHTRDPITNLEVYTGFHTSRTARIEPITPPGQVYASGAFAAVAAATGVNDLEFGYVGRIRLAKKYGSLALYHVQRP